MIEYSKQESEIFGIRFGRLNIEENFSDWSALKNEIEITECKFIRIKIKNPNPTTISEIKNLSINIHLIEILRSYTTTSLHLQIIENKDDTISYVKVDSNNKNIFLDTILDTYEDIPFGSYTPVSVLKHISSSVQLYVLSQYFYENYYGNFADKEAYLIYNSDHQIAGCLAIDFFKNESYSYYVGVRKEFRKQDILLNSIFYIHRNTQSKKLEFAKGSARLHNLYSQKAFDKSGMSCTGYDWIFLVEK